MSKLFPTLFSPAKIGNLEVKNRIMKAPQSTGMSNMDGSVSERLVRYYADQAAGGTGLIIVEYAYVDNIASKSAHCQLGISTNDHIPGLAWLAGVIRDKGAVPGIQIEHCGRQKFLGTQPIVAPSAIPWPKLFNMVGYQAVPHELTIPEIVDIVESFGDAALRAKLAGYELVEIHGAHGYLLTNFFSPHTNKRNDWYGGSLENRSRIYLDILRNIRKKVGPDMCVTIRLSGTDYEPDGFPIEDTIQLAKWLEEEGIDGIDVSGGDHHQMIHQVTPMSIEVCHNVWAAEAIKKEVSVPIIASGSITLPKYAEDIIASGKADFVALGRPLWADPQWSNKACEDRPLDIRPCIRCNEGCLERTFFRFNAITCAVNPIISREGDLKIAPAPAGKSVAVVGGGPAGLEAARVLKLRGHDVTLFERNKLGGSLHEAAAPDFKKDIVPLIENLVHQVEQLGITVVSKDASLEDLAGKFDAYVVACGADEVKLRLPGADKPHVVSVMDVINGRAEAKGKIAMIGGGLVGTESAIELKEAGKDVYVVEMLDQIMTGLATTDLIAYAERIEKIGMKSYVKTRLEEIKDNTIVVKTPKGIQELPADTVVIAVGFTPRDGLYKALKAQSACAVNVGDSIQANKIMDAIHTGYRAGLSI